MFGGQENITANHDDISIDELRKVPYLDVDAVEFRTVNLMLVWDGTRWHMWAPTPVGLIPLQIAETIEIDYVAKEPADESDLLIPFVELMWQRASWPEICPLISAIIADFHNFGTAIEKLDHYFRHRLELEWTITQFVKTELEYIFILSRSIFDLLKETVALIWNTKIRLRDADAESRRKQRKLPTTFSKVVVGSGNVLRTSDELIQTYALAPRLAETYVAAAPFFTRVRKARDEVVHLGKDARLLFVTEPGFCLPKEQFGFGDLHIWKPEHQENENLVSLLPLLAYVVLGTIETCNAVMIAFANSISLPRDVAPGYRIFFRGPHNDGLLWMLRVAQGASPWWSERQLPKQDVIRQRAYFHWKDRTGEAWWDLTSNWLQAERDVKARMPKSK